MITPIPFFLERFRALYPGAVFSASRPLSLRVNTIRCNREELENDLGPFAPVPAAWYGGAYSLPGVSARDLEELTETGKAYIQSLSSMIPALVLAPKPGERVLDLAAAPGSKTSQMAALMENRGEIVANDVDRRRIFKLKAVLSRLGVINATVVSRPGQGLWKAYPEAFDKVLLDAPCSMEGSLFPPRKKIRAIAKLQRWLLRSAVSAARPGGTIVYSTCSMAPEENEEVVAWILEKEKGKIELAEIDLPIPEAVPGITAWQESSFDPSLSRTMRIPPTSQMEQFFVAKLVKTAATVPESIEPES